MSIYDHEDDWFDHERQQYVSSRKRGRPLGPGNPHYPNKAERALLVQIAQKSGLTEEEIRQNPDHRRALAKAAASMMKSPAPYERYNKLIKREKRKIADRLSCPVYDPRVTAALDQPDVSGWGMGQTPRQRVRAAMGYWR